MIYLAATPSAPSWMRKQIVNSKIFVLSRSERNGQDHHVEVEANWPHRAFNHRSIHVGTFDKSRVIFFKKCWKFVWRPPCWSWLQQMSQVTTSPFESISTISFRSVDRGFFHCVHRRLLLERVDQVEQWVERCKQVEHATCSTQLHDLIMQIWQCNSPRVKEEMDSVMAVLNTGIYGRALYAVLSKTEKWATRFQF